MGTKIRRRTRGVSTRQLPVHSASFCFNQVLGSLFLEIVVVSSFGFSFFGLFEGAGPLVKAYNGLSGKAHSAVLNHDVDPGGATISGRSRVAIGLLGRGHSTFN